MDVLFDVQIKYLYGYKTIEEVIKRMYDNKLNKKGGDYNDSKTKKVLE